MVITLKVVELLHTAIPGKPDKVRITYRDMPEMEKPIQVEHNLMPSECRDHAKRTVAERAAKIGRIVRDTALMGRTSVRVIIMRPRES